MKTYALRDKWKGRQVRELGRYLRRHTDLPVEEVTKYQTILHGLDSTELRRWEAALYELEDVPAVDVKQQHDRLRRASAHAKTLKKDSLLDTSRLSVARLADRYSIDSLTLDGAWHQLSQEKREEWAQALGVTTDALDTLSLAAWKDQWATARQQVQDTVSATSLEQLATHEAIEARLQELVAEQAARQRLELEAGPGATETLTTPVKAYLPQLETFDYEPPEIPEEPLTKALLEAEKERKLQELKATLLPEQTESEEERPRFYERLTIGGAFEYVPSPERIVLTPTIGYGFNQTLSVGVGYHASIPLDGGADDGRIDGYRLFADYRFFKTYYAHVETEWLRQRPSAPEEPLYTEQNTYLGIGKAFQYRSLTAHTLVLYHVDAPSALQPRTFVFRFGITYSKR